MQELTGANLIAGVERREGPDTYRAVDPRTGKEHGPAFHDATDEEVTEAVHTAAAAFDELRAAPFAAIELLLRGAAQALEDLGDQLIEVAEAETGLGEARLQGERARTCGQLRAFADVVAEGSHLDVRIDLADPSTTPPKPDLRRMQVPIGPVAVFGASNFPLAFSVPGGDTAAALAAGCPVVAKAHPSHPGTSELAGRAITAAVAQADLPSGTFSLVHGRDVRVGGALVQADQIKAVGFTGSERGGRALFDLAAARPEPIPVYAEMGSLNPTFVTPGALDARSAEVAEGLVGSMTLGTGQFCTKPGLVFVPDSDAGRAFCQQVAETAAATEPGVLLNAGVAAGLRERLGESMSQAGVQVLAEGAEGAEGTGFTRGATVLATDLDTFRATPALSEEHFGPVTVLVRCDGLDEMAEAARFLPGGLTASVHGETDEADEVKELLATVREIAGRVIWNQFPTGVAVTHAMHHGGPYPAATFPAHTSVGSAAIRRFLRPVVYQNTPQELLPDVLRDDRAGLMRMVDGRWTSDRIT